MTIYKNGSEQIAVGHGRSFQSNMFLVRAIKGDESKSHICHTLIVAAESDHQAITLVKANAKAVIEKLREIAKPEDFETYQVFQECNPIERKHISEQINKLMDIEEPTEADVFDLEELRSKLKELDKGKPIGKESQFTRRIERMQYLLDPHVTFRAERIDGDRAIPVSYFDDPRDISSL